MRRDGTLVLQQGHALDKRGLDVESARKLLYSINGQGRKARIAVGD